MPPLSLVSSAETVQAARDGAVLAVGGYYGVIEVKGPDRARWLHGLTSNKVKELRPGEGNYATLLSGKGKMIAEAWVLCREESLLVVSRPEHRERVLKTLEQYLLMDDVNLADRSASYAVVGVNGTRAAETVKEIYDVTPPEREGHHVAGKSWQEVEVLAVNEVGLPGLLLLVPVDMAEMRISEFCIPLADADVLDVLRVEGGIPRWGQDMDGETIPVEVGLEQRAISYDKGCYVGQEIIARIKTYGEPAKKLWGIRWSGEGTVAAKTPFTREGKDAGWVTSSVVSPTLGSISLGYVKRTEGKAGAEVRTADGRSGTLVSLPFVGR